MKGYTPQELIQWTPPVHRCIIGNNILIDRGTMMIYGKEETWKSMLIGLDLTFKIANGKDWLGYKTTPSPVYVFQTEIPQAPLRDRMIKYMNGNKLNSSQIWYGSELYLKIDKGWGFSELEKEIARTQPKVLVVDPIFSSMSGNLIDDYDVGLFLDRLDMLRSKYNVAVILIHHSRIAEHSEGETYHYGTDEIFGSSRFPRWMDTIIHITKVNDSSSTNLVNLHLNFEKTRHSEFKIPDINVVVNRNNLTFNKEL